MHVYMCIVPLDTNAQVSTRVYVSVCVCVLVSVSVSVSVSVCVFVYTAGHQADDAVEQGKEAHTHKHTHTHTHAHVCCMIETTLHFFWSFCELDVCSRSG